MAKNKDIKQGYKPSPLGLIPSDWSIKTISEAYNICNNLRFPINQEERKKIKGEYPYYGPTKIQDYINEFRVEGKYALIGEDGDHFLKWKELPMTQLVSGKFNVNNHAHLVQGKTNLTEWFFYFYNHRELTPFLTRQGAGRYKLTKDALAKMPIALPPIAEQKRITHLLTTWDKAIARMDLLIAKKELRKKWVMQQLISGKKRIRGYNGKWKSLRFKDIYFQTSEKVGDKKIMVLSVTKSGIVSQSDYFKKEIASEDSSGYLVVRKGDMVMSGLNFWMGAIDVVYNHEIGIVSPAYKVFQIINKDISPEFMRFFIRSKEMLRALVGSSVIGASIVRRNMDRETLDEWTFHMPELKEQIEISKVLEVQEVELQLMRNKLNALRRQKAGLMQLLLTGKKRLKI